MYEEKLWTGGVCGAVDCGNTSIKGFPRRPQRCNGCFMNENELATIALDICFNIHRKFGPGLFESVYEEIFCYEWAKTGISFKRQHGIPVVHEDIRMEIGFRADVILNDKVIVEIKSVESIADVHLKQVSTYLRLTNLKLGLLVNFNVVLLKNGIKRIANKI
jgi:GxxExxY protein